MSEKLFEDGLSPIFLSSLAELSLFFAKYLIIFSKKIGRIEENYLNKKKVLLDNHLSTNLLYFQIKY
jgi:hypothetical protein